MAAEWTPELTVNDDLLDEQHVELFRRLAAAGSALDGTKAEAEKAIAAFADVLMEHVAEEEQLMEETFYPERGRHRTAHELFVADFARMREELAEKGPTALIAEWVRVRIPEWLRFHIRVNDAPFGAYLARRRQAGGGGARPSRHDGRRLS